MRRRTTLQQAWAKSESGNWRSVGNHSFPGNAPLVDCGTQAASRFITHVVPKNALFYRASAPLQYRTIRVAHS